jgi:hypothetical protein
MKLAKPYDPADYATPEAVRELVRYAAEMEERAEALERELRQVRDWQKSRER